MHKRMARFIFRKSNGFIAALLLYFFVLFFLTQPLRKAKRQLVVIMLDSIRWDYLERMSLHDLGGFVHFKETGVRAEFVESVFPSLTYPAWMTLQTGLYPDIHNQLGNNMYDRKTGLEFIESMHLPMWHHGEPIWVTATKLGLRVAVYNWCTENLILYPALPEVYSYTVFKDPFVEKIEDVISKLREEFDLILMWYCKTGYLGNTFGPASPQVLEELRYVGSGLERLFSFVKNKERAKGVHVMVVSGNGLAPCVPLLKLNDYIDEEHETENIIVDDVISIFAKPTHKKALLHKLQNVSHFATFSNTSIPEEFHYKGGVYAPDILLVPKLIAGEHSQRHDPHGGGELERAGCNGFDPKEPDMRTIFLGWGSSLVGGGRLYRPLRLVDIYQLYGHVLGLSLPPHNGSWETVRSMLRS